MVMSLELKVLAKHLVTTGYTGREDEDPILYLQRDLGQKSQQLSSIHPNAPKVLNEVEELAWNTNVNKDGWEKENGVAAVVKKYGLHPSAAGLFLEYRNFSALYQELLRREAKRNTRIIS